MRIGKATTLAPVFRLASLHPKVPQSAAVSSSVLEAGALAQMLNSCPATLYGRDVGSVVHICLLAPKIAFWAIFISHDNRK
jgi:hypothetical protein